MSVTLQRGANTSLQAAIAEHGSRLRVVLEWAGDHPAHPSVDAVAFLLTESGKVRSDGDMIFYNHPTEAGGFIIMAAGENVARGLHVQAFTLDLDKVPEGIERVCFCLTLQSSGPGGLLYLSQLGQTALRVLGGPADTELVRADFNMGETQETALIMGEVYRRKGEWKVKCVAQGFASGLGALAESYGVVVAEAAQAVGQMIPPDAAPAPQMPKSATPSQHFQKPPGGFGEVQVILNWGVPPVPGAAAEPPPVVAAAPKGFLGNLMGANKGAPAAKVHKTADLDLCCLFELTDGYRGIVQALGNNFGGFQTAPYVELMGDERQGSGVQAEIMRLNGKRWDEVRRLLFFAMIFEGVPNWAKANGRARILVPEQVPVSVRLDMATMDQRVCSIALIENEGGKMVVHKRVETFKNPRELDQHYGWGLRWSAGTKD
jgi:tellurite resistance protein TerA